MSRIAPGYLAYMLRLWPASSEQGSPWRASLENPYTGERVAFANREMMFAFLEAQIARFERRGYEAPNALGTALVVPEDKGLGAVDQQVERAKKTRRERFSLGVDTAKS